MIATRTTKNSAKNENRRCLLTPKICFKKVFEQCLKPVDIVAIELLRRNKLYNFQFAQNISKLKKRQNKFEMKFY